MLKREGVDLGSILSCHLHYYFESQSGIEKQLLVTTKLGPVASVLHLSMYFKCMFMV